MGGLGGNLADYASQIRYAMQQQGNQQKQRAESDWTCVSNQTSGAQTTGGSMGAMTVNYGNSVPQSCSFNAATLLASE